MKKLTEKELENRFWELADQITEPLIKIAESHTSPSIERSVLLRMGFSSLEAAAIVKQASDKMLLGKGPAILYILFQKKAEKLCMKQEQRCRKEKNGTRLRNISRKGVR